MDKLLILGGTNFIGRNLVNLLLQLNLYDITLFNRGKSNPDLFPDLKKIKGDRDTDDIDLIFENKWDFVIDLSCYFPNSLSRLLSGINNDLKGYIFISTCSVYDNELYHSRLRDENAPLLICNEDDKLDSSPATYGKRKAECERLLSQSGIKHSIFRPALVYGPFDPTDRFYYWLFQIKKGKSLLIPNKGEGIFSVTYVKDLVQVIVKSLTLDITSNSYNAISNPTLSISKLIEVVSKQLDQLPDLYTADSEFLNQNNVAQWTDLPLWLDCDFFTYNNAKIKVAPGMDIADFEDAVSETIEYFDKLGWPEPKFGISEKRKEELIEKVNR